jgi:hypothetical protein
VEKEEDKKIRDEMYYVIFILIFFRKLKQTSSC